MLSGAEGRRVELCRHVPLPASKTQSPPDFLGSLRAALCSSLFVNIGRFLLRRGVSVTVAKSRSTKLKELSFK